MEKCLRSEDDVLGIAFYSHTIDRCLITKEEEKNSYSVIERSAVQAAFSILNQEQ
jgi:hypothetical protein